MKTSVASTHATYGPGSRRRTRSDGRTSTATTNVTGNRIEVYFDEKARPSVTPATHHHPNDSRERGSDCSARTTPYNARALHASSGASGVASTNPDAASGMSANTSAAHRAATSPAMRRAMPIAANDATPPARTGTNRTANAVWPPNSADNGAPARMSTAIIGG